MQGIISFLVVCIFLYFGIDLEGKLKELVIKIPGMKTEEITKNMDIIKPILFSAAVVIIQKIIYSLEFLKIGFFIKIVQVNKRNREEFKTIINQQNIIEKNRTVISKITLNSKKSIRNYFMKKIIKNKEIYLCIFLEEEDKRYISLSSDEGEEENSTIKFNITSYINQILNLELPKDEEGAEEFEYLINLELESSQEKKKRIIVNSKFLIGNEDYDKVKIFYFFKLKRLLKLEYKQHIVELNKEKE